MTADVAQEMASVGLLLCTRKRVYVQRCACRVRFWGWRTVSFVVLPGNIRRRHTLVIKVGSNCSQSVVKCWSKDVPPPDSCMLRASVWEGWPMPWHFGPFRLDLTNACLWRAAQPVPLRLLGKVAAHRNLPQSEQAEAHCNTIRQCSHTLPRQSVWGRRV